MARILSRRPPRYCGRLARLAGCAAGLADGRGDRLEPAEGGTNLTESFEVRWLPPTAVLAEDFLMRDRDRRRDEAMRATLGRIKAAVESAVTGGTPASS